VACGGGTDKHWRDQDIAVNDLNGDGLMDIIQIDAGIVIYFQNPAELGQMLKPVRILADE
jgi:hypothetical protein